MSKKILKSLLLIVLWYTCNILVVISNKYLLSNYGFKFPVFLTGCHMVACAFWGYVASAIHVVPQQRIQSTWQLAKITVLAAVFCLTVVMGNVSLRYIPVSFNQAIGATTPFFTAFLSVLVNCTPESPIVYASLVPVVVGIIVATGGEPLFHIIGFLAALSATCGRAFKSVLQALLLSDSSEKMDSVNLLRHMAPIAAVLLVPVTVLAEREVLKVVRQKAVGDQRFLPALMTNATLAFFANLTNFAITKHTSALTLQVLGNAKGVVAACISILIFKNPVTLQGAVGYAIALLGVAFYSHAKGVTKQTVSMDINISGKEEALLPVVSAPKTDVPATPPRETEASNWPRNALKSVSPAPIKRASPIQERPSF